MASDGRVVIDTELNNKGFVKGVKGLQKDMGGLNSAAKRLAGTMAAAFSAKVVLDFGRACIELGSNVAEVQNVVDTSFGDMKWKVEDFAANAIENFGMSTLAAKKTASTYMAMARGMGIAEDAASDMAISLAGMTGDVASFYNISQELADVKLKSVFTGETETLKDLGVVMTQANLKQYALSKGITKGLESMTQAELVALRYGFVMDALSLAQGDFVKTQDSWANQTRILAMQWQEFMSLIGQTLTTVLLPLVQVLNWVVSGLIGIGKAVASLFATEESGAEGAAASIGSAVDNQNALTGAVKETTKAQKKSMASFDEINKLSAPSTGGSGSGATAGGGFAGIPIPAYGASIGAGMDEALEKAEKLLSVVSWIGAGMLAWKFGSGLLGSMQVFLGALLAIKGGIMAVKGAMDVLNNGANADNVTDIFIGLMALTGGLLAAFGPTAAAIGMIIGAIATLALGIQDVTKNGRNMHNMALVLSGLLMGGLGISVLTGSMIPALVGGILAILAAITVLAGNGGQLIQNLQDTFGGLKDFVVGIITGDLDLAFDGLKRTVKGVINTILTVFGSAVNLIIRGINWIIGKINSISFTPPDWVPVIGGKTWGPSIPEIPEWQIPQLAKGAVLPPNKPFMAMLGDQKSGTNVEAPLDTIVQAMRIALGGSGGKSEAIMVLDDEVIGKLIYKLYGRESRRVGVTLKAGAL